MEIWNSRSLDNNQRFLAAIAAGVLAAVGLGIAYGLLYSLLRVTSAILYIFIGWCIGQVIRKVGRGVHNRFGVAGAVCTLLAIMIGDLISVSGFYILVHPSLWGAGITLWLRMFLSTNINSVLGIVLRAFGVYMAYHYSVIF